MQLKYIAYYLFTRFILQSVYTGKGTDITMKLDTNKHSVFLLYYHLVLVTKYRKQVIDDEISDYAKSTFERIAEPILP